MNWKRILSIVALAVILFLAAFFAWKIGQKRGYSSGFSAGVESVKADTVTKIDTHYVDRPVPVEVKPSGQEMYPVGTLAQLKKVIDSLSAVKPDTTFIEIPIPTETKLYADSTYRLQISGVQPRLDWIETYARTEIVNHYFPQLPSVTVTPAVKVFITPVGIDAAAMLRVTKWWTGGWRFDGGAGYGIHLGEGIQQPGWYAEIGFGYDIIRH